MKREEFIAICRKSQRALKTYLKRRLKKKYKKIIEEPGFLFAKGDFPVLLVAHLDTVHKELPQNIICEEDKIYSLQGIGGDDRCGVYEILQIIEKHKCSVLFCEDEEIGGVGAVKFVKSKYAKDLKPNYIIELDRRGKTDAVFYDCDNPEFTDFITGNNFWIESCGSFSDISYIAPSLGVAAVNLSSGYYNAHTTKEYVVPSEIDVIIRNVIKLLDKTKETDKFQYIEAKSDFEFKRRNYYDSYNIYGFEEEKGAYYFFIYTDEGGIRKCAEVIANSMYEAMGIFFEEHENISYRMVEEIEEYIV